jgi:hypothetical protein
MSNWQNELGNEHWFSRISWSLQGHIGRSRLCHIQWKSAKPKSFPESTSYLELLLLRLEIIMHLKEQTYW